MRAHSREQLIDAIYTAATLPEARHDAVKALQDYFRADAGGLYAVTVSDKSVIPIDVQGIEQTSIESYKKHYVRCNPWLDTPQFMKPGCIRTDMLLDQFHNCPGFYRKTAYYNEWFRPQGFSHSLSTTLRVDKKCDIRFYLYRGNRIGGFDGNEIDDFRDLSHHLSRAAGIMQEFAGLESRNMALAQVVDGLDAGIVFLDRNGFVLKVNEVADRLLASRDALVTRNGCLHAVKRSDDVKFIQSLQGAIAIHQGMPDQSSARLVVPRPGGKRPLCITFIPLGHNPDVTGIYDAAVAIFITDPERKLSIDKEQFCKYYEFTRAEALLAECLVQGLSLRDAAKVRGIRYETARWRLKLMFQKTGTHRQVELVQLLLSETRLNSPKHG